MADGHSPLLGVSQRLPPSNLQAEQSLLGAILAQNRAYEPVASFLMPVHFADQVHGYIYRRITERILDGHLADAVSMRNDFEHNGVLQEVGGVTYLAQLLASMVGIVNAREYGREIYDCWLRRQLIQVGEEVVNNAFGGGMGSNGERQIEEAQQALSRLGSATEYHSSLVSGGQAIQRAVDRALEAHRTGQTPGVIFGIPTVDAALDGLISPGTLTLLAGLPGSGKTALVGQMGKSLGLRTLAAGMASGLSPAEAERLPGMLIVSMEMSAEEIGLRMAAEEAGLAITMLRKGNLDMAATMNVSRALDSTRNIPLRIHDMVGLPYRLAIPKIQMHLQRQPELVVAFDHLLVMTDDEPDSRGKQSGLDAASVSWLTRNLKKLARRLGVAIIALTHTPRPKEGIQRRPIASDVKWAGEGDADNVLFVHRPIMTMPDTPPPRGRMTDEAYRGPNGPLLRWENERAALGEVAELVVAKARSGPSGGVHRMRWHGATTSLREWRSQEIMEVPEEFDAR